MRGREIIIIIIIIIIRNRKEKEEVGLFTRFHFIPSGSSCRRRKNILWWDVWILDTG